jgi:Stage II sporulation protein E (SpoIIE)
MGHSINASILATVLVGGLRNARRAGVGLAEQARLANAGLFEYAKHGEFVTGHVARIDLRAETATIVNAGHHRRCDSAGDASTPSTSAPTHRLGPCGTRATAYSPCRSNRVTG